jgi:hypothetical protein
MKRTALMISTLCLMASQMASAQVMTPKSPMYYDIIEKRDVTLSWQEGEDLQEEIVRLSKLDNKSLKEEDFINSLQKQISCRAGDILIIGNGVGEGIPVIAAATREMNANYLFDVNPKLAYYSIKKKRISWSNLFGGVLTSIPGVVIVSVSSGMDKKEIQKEIEKAFPGTALLTYKLQGEASFCGQKTLKGDIIDALKKLRGL